MTTTDRPAPAGAEHPIDDDGFAAMMARLGPFEPSARIAVAVSGGPDSMALCLLADRWARRQGGAVQALTVDHRLRPESVREAETVARWLNERGIAHRILTWRGGAASGSLQAEARRARYQLVEQACREAGILHLLLAHTLDDQAETVLLRLSKGSGPDGLAGMAAIRETASVRMLRPLLGVEKRRLYATCRRFGQAWIDDPSNLAPRFARGRLRRVSAMLDREGLSADRLADTARRAGRSRNALEEATGALLGRAAAIYPEGYATLDRARLLGAPEDLALRALARCLLVIGSGRHPPRLDRLERLYRELRANARTPGRTLAGCRILAHPDGRLLICREAAATPVLALAADAGGSVIPELWDGRFQVTLPASDLPAGLEVRRLGVQGRAALRSSGRSAARMPPAAALSLPGLWAGERLIGLPKFVPLQRRPKSCRLEVCGVRFVPQRRLTDPAFAVV